jgi:hypothetical protein
MGADNKRVEWIGHLVIMDHKRLVNNRIRWGGGGGEK